MDRLGTESAVMVVTLSCAAVGFLVMRRSGFWSPLALTLFTTFGVILIHLNFASLGWFYRYESYLLATGIAFSTIGLASLLPSLAEVSTLARNAPLQVAASALVLTVLAMPLRRRATSANEDTPIACRNIYEQQVQSARFLSNFRGPVAVNDIGAVAWLGNDEVVDLVGLANLAIAKAKGLKLDHPLSQADIERFTNQTNVAVVYDEWFPGSLPPRWLRIGRWTIEGNRTCAFPSVSIYATNPATYPEVFAALRRFDTELPRDVRKSGRYRVVTGKPDRPRHGDRILIHSTAREVNGSYVVDDGGVVLLPTAGPVYVDHATDDEIATRANRMLRGRAAISAVEHLPSQTPFVNVVGQVSSAIETSTLTLDAAIAEAGGAGKDAGGAWVWREDGTGTFTRLSRTELSEGERLQDGDIVVVP
jgi:hypothetical protein